MVLSFWVTCKFQYEKGTIFIPNVKSISQIKSNEFAFHNTAKARAAANKIKYHTSWFAL